MMPSISKHPKYSTWLSMKARCNNPNVESYPRYGGRGISICDRWSDSFVSFIEDMGDPPSIKHSIERKDNDGNYEPGNCRWATIKEQNRNTRKNVMYTINGDRKCLAEWCEIYDVGYRFVWHRINREGWSVVPALTTPKIPHKERGTGRTPLTVTYKGESLTVAQWATRTGIKEMTIYRRIRVGKSADDILKL